MDDPLIPHLKVVHEFPSCFNRVGIDRGAIRFVLSGATLMAPGLTSKGGRLPEDGGQEFEEGDVVVVEAEGKEEVRSFKLVVSHFLNRLCVWCNTSTTLPLLSLCLH